MLKYANLKRYSETVIASRAAETSVDKSPLSSAVVNDEPNDQCQNETTRSTSPALKVFVSKVVAKLEQLA